MRTSRHSVMKLGRCLRGSTHTRTFAGLRVRAASGSMAGLREIAGVREVTMEPAGSCGHAS